MGRTKYSTEEKNKVISSFIEAAAAIIEEEGVDAVSIRKVASRAGYSSATMYLYFKDLDELVIMASFCYLRNYLQELKEDSSAKESNAAAYFASWKHFCEQSFANAHIYYQLWFGKHSVSVNNLLEKYYNIFPEEIEDINDLTVSSMLISGDLTTRCIRVLLPYAYELGFTEDEAHLINDMTISYYRELLERCTEKNPTKDQIQYLTDKFLTAARFILTGRPKSTLEFQH